MLLLKLNFQDEGQMYANFLFYILIMLRKFFAFQFFSRAIRMQIPILTGVQNEPKSHRNDSAFLLINVLFMKLLFHNEGYLYASFLFYIMIIYGK